MRPVILFCCDRNQSEVAAIQPDEIATFLSVYPIVVVQIVRIDITESARRVSSVVHCPANSEWQSDVAAALALDFKFDSRWSVNDSLVASGGCVRTLIVRARKKLRFPWDHRFLVGAIDLLETAGV